MKITKKMLVRLGLSTTGVLTVATLLAACNNMSVRQASKVTSGSNSGFFKVIPHFLLLDARKILEVVS